jgi:DNA polymerase III subunit epsilon
MATREIVFDTETTGLDPAGADRIVEIGAIELINHIPSGKTFHRYINPERGVPLDAVRVHGLDDAFLKDKPVFSAIIGELLDFIGDAALIAHNAEFDLAFVNAELQRAGVPPLSGGRLIDTLTLARRKHPAAPNSLDALCARYQIDLSRRTFHGALLDSELLAEVYVELIGGRQASLVLGEDLGRAGILLAAGPAAVGARPVPRLFRVSEAEMAAHRARIALLGGKAIWLGYLVAAEAA